MILNMYITLMPVIIAGIINMIFTKTSVYRKYRYPIDGVKKLKDGKRLFGDNKTWIGFFSMIIFTSLAQIIWGSICSFNWFIGRNYLYNAIENTVLNNLFIGALFGLAYVLCELPNSYIKRRIDIAPGKTVTGVKGVICYLFDQIDSIIGVTLILCIWCKITLFQFLLYIFLGGITHIIVNLILYGLRIRKNI